MHLTSDAGYKEDGEERRENERKTLQLTVASHQNFCNVIYASSNTNVVRTSLDRYCSYFAKKLHDRQRTQAVHGSTVVIACVG